MHSSLLLARSKAATAAAGYPKYDKKKNEKRSNPLSGGDVTGRELLPVATRVVTGTNIGALQRPISAIRLENSAMAAIEWCLHG